MGSALKTAIETGAPIGDAAAIDEIFCREIEEHRLVLAATASELRADFARAVNLVAHGVRSGGKLLLFGNGGSAADAQHIAAEFVVRYRSDRRAIPAVALTTDTSALTACANDLGYEAVFERQIEALGRPGDIAVGISTSGRSENVLRGLRWAREAGLRTLGLTGSSGADMVSLCDVTIAVPSQVTARIQEMHITIGHMLCLALESLPGVV